MATVQEALQQRMKESRERIMSTLCSPGEQLLNQDEVANIVDHELQMLMCFGERLIQMGATTGQEVKREH